MTMPHAPARTTLRQNRARLLICGDRHRLPADHSIGDPFLAAEFAVASTRA
jgi:hypothetical protein